MRIMVEITTDELYILWKLLTLLKFGDSEILSPLEKEIMSELRGQLEELIVKNSKEA